MKNKMFTIAVSMLLSAGFVAEALAQSPAALVRQRQSAMVLIGKYMGQMGPMALGKAPYNAAAFASAAANMEVLSKMPWDGFTPATQGEKSRALPEVYTDAAKFKQAADNFTAEATKVAAATKSGNEQTVKAAWGELNKSCAACHDSFRARQ